MGLLSPLVAQILCLALLLPATARVTRLVTTDKMPLLAYPRDAFVRRWGVYEDSTGDERRTAIGGKRTNWVMASLAYLWECSWCASIWVGAGLAYLTYAWPQVTVWILAALVASYFTGWAAKFEAICDRRDES